MAAFRIVEILYPGLPSWISPARTRSSPACRTPSSSSLPGMAARSHPTAT